MKRIIVMVIGGAALLAGILFFQAVDNNSTISADKGEKISLSNTAGPAGKYQTQSDKQARVTVEVTPKELGLNSEKNIFEVNLNTHSVELDYDFAKIMTLADSLGNGYDALEWTGNSGWHHVSGDIIFPRLNSQAKSITLKVDGVGGVDRVFSWEL